MPLGCALIMRVEIKISRPKRWKENLLVNALVSEGVPKEYFMQDISKDVEILITNSLQLEELNNLKKLEHLIIPTSGIEGVCIEELLKKRIKIYHNPSITSKGVANYVTHNLGDIFGGDMAEVMNRATIGLLGFGNVGKEIYESLKRYGCSFEAFTRKTAPPFEINSRKGTSGLLNLLSNSDVIINTLPLNNGTRGLLYEKNSQIKREALIVSVSRSGIIDDRAVLEDIIRGYLTGAILDVYSDDINPDDYNNKNIILTPHIAGIYGNALGNLVQFIKKSIDVASRG